MESPSEELIVRIRILASVFVLAALTAAACSTPVSRTSKPAPPRVSVTTVDTRTLSAEDSRALSVYEMRWTGAPEGVRPVRYTDVRSLVASAPWVVYPTETFGRRLIGIFYMPGTSVKHPDPRTWNPYVDWVELVYEGGLEVRESKHQETAVGTLTHIYYVQQGLASTGWGQVTTVGPYPAISREATDGRGGFGMPSSSAASVSWIADDVAYSVEGGRGGSAAVIDPAWLPLDKVLAVARSAVRPPARVTPERAARPDRAGEVLLEARRKAGGKTLADNYEAVGLFPNLLWPKETLGRKLVAIVYDRVPPRHKAKVAASGRGDSDPTPWYPRITLVYEDGLTVTEEIDELTYEGLSPYRTFSVKEYTTAFGVPGYIGAGRLEFMLSATRYTVDGPKLTRAQLEQVAHSMLP